MKEREKANVIIENIRLEGRRSLTEHESKGILKAYGIPTTREGLAVNLEAALGLAEEIGFPLVLKVCSPDVVHKSDIGGVIVGLKTPSEVKEAYGGIVESVSKHKPRARILGVLVQEMVPPGHEVIVGATRDAQFGPVVMFGLGGVFVEVLRDVSFRLAPLTREEALELMRETRGFRLLEGFRGSKPADLEALADVVTKVGRIITELPEITEIDINPLFVYNKGVVAVDARVILSQP
ncbi:MAG: acetate--CoA ligase family protein [Candidatus Bathyarchaeia archaeon]